MDCWSGDNKLAPFHTKVNSIEKVNFMVREPFFSRLEYMKAPLKMVLNTDKESISLKTALSTKVNIAITGGKAEECCSIAINN